MKEGRKEGGHRSTNTIWCIYLLLSINNTISSTSINTHQISTHQNNTREYFLLINTINFDISKVFNKWLNNTREFVRLINQSPFDQN